MKRDLVIALVAVAALCGSLVAAGGTLRERDERLRGYVDPTQTADLPFRVPLLGVNAELTQYEDDELAAQLDLMEQAQIHWVRQFFAWEGGDPNWAALDPLINAFARRDLELVAVLTVADIPPDDPAEFAAFARDFAARYGAVVDYYQIGDEPNLTAAWGGEEPRPAAYAALLRASYDAIHSADSGATVIAAALAPTIENTALNISDAMYLDALYRLGVADYADAFAAKPYGFDFPPDDYTVDYRRLNFSRIVALREVMVEHGDGKTALWASNWGWNSLPEEWTGAPSLWGQVSADQRVAYTLGALDRAEREWAWLGGMILYQWQPNAPPDDPVWGFSLLAPDGEPTPLLDALIQREPNSAAYNGLYFPANPYTRYSGVWTFGELGADIGWINDSQFEVDFVGSSVALLLRQDDYLAFLYPTIDGRADLANAAPRDPNGSAFINLRSGSNLPELALVPVARDLPETQHALSVVADRGWDRWAIAGIAVSSGDLAAPYNRQIGVALLTAAISGLSAGLALRRLNWSPLARRLSAIWTALGGVGQLALSVITSLAVMIGMLLTWSDAVPNLFRREPLQLGLALLTAGLIYVQPHVVITLIGVALLFVIIYHRLDLGVLLAVFYAPFFLFPVELYEFAFPMSELVILITFAAWVIRGLAAVSPLRIRGGVKKGFFDPFQRFTIVDWGVVALVALGVISLAWSAERGKAITELRVMIVEPALLYLMLRTVTREQKTLLRVIDALVIAGVIVAVIGLVMYAGGQGVITAEGGARRLASVYGSPNNVGLLLGRCIPFALAFALAPLDRARRLWAVGALLIMGVAALLSQSAGAIFIGIPTATLVVLLLSLRQRARFAVIGLAGAGAALFAVAMQFPRFARVFDVGEGTSFFRIRVWQSAIQMIAERPITGWGLDQFLSAFRGRYMMPDAWQEPSLSHPHNFLLDWWTRLGLFGVLIFAWLQFAFWRAALRVYRQRPPAFHLAILIGAMGSMVNLLAHGAVDNSVYVPDLAVIFALLLATAANFDESRP